MSSRNYIRLEKKYSPDEVLPFVVSNKHSKNAQRNYDGNIVKMASDRYKTFKNSGLKCVSCGIEGQYFVLERGVDDKQNKRFHFNLYAIDKDGNEVLMTKDHIYPKSKGGRNLKENLQTMCKNCNCEKSDKIE
jgi:5-methylcytosine-specific restriction endonuclease McrA